LYRRSRSAFPPGMSAPCHPLLPQIPPHLSVVQGFFLLFCPINSHTPSQKLTASTVPFDSSRGRMGDDG
ncbi:unnamed protein product, partial [Closterium sp. Naga37s-1]